MGDVPFEQTDSGNYRVVEPIGGMEPDELSVHIGDRRYTLHGYVGKDKSKLHPDILVYEHCETTVIDA